MLVEPNLDMHQKYELIDYKIAIEELIWSFIW